jgi:hypothetical protein
MRRTIVAIALAGGLAISSSACSGSTGGGASSPPASSPGSGSSQTPAGGTSSHATGPSAQSSPGDSWRGQFADYGGTSWQNSWGYIDHGSFGQDQLSEISDSSAPGNGGVLQVKYGRGSSANSCSNCPNPGGGQFYTQFSSMGRSDLANANVLYLRYYVKFPTGFDFGRGGKLPGLFGGPVGHESGGNHGQAFSTRYMWRDHPVSGSLTNCSSASPCSEVYLYAPRVSSGYGGDIGGRWNWQADGRWHMIEQEVNRTSGDITVWYDGAKVLSSPGALGDVSSIPFSGVLFSTFFGGHDVSWGPGKTEYAYFADFAVSTGYIGA